MALQFAQPAFDDRRLHQQKGAKRNKQRPQGDGGDGGDAGEVGGG